MKENRRKLQHFKISGDINFSFCHNRVPRTGHGRSEPGNAQEDTAWLHLPSLVQSICSARCCGKKLSLREVQTRLRLASVFLWLISMFFTILRNRILQRFFKISYLLCIIIFVLVGFDFNFVYTLFLCITRVSSN